MKAFIIGMAIFAAPLMLPPLAFAQTPQLPISLFGFEVGKVLDFRSNLCEPVERVHDIWGDKQLMGYKMPDGKDVCFRDAGASSSGIIAVVPMFTRSLPWITSSVRIGINGSSGVVEEIEVLTAKTPLLDTVLADLTAKFGSPTSQDIEKYQNGFGAIFNATTAIWDFPDGSEITFASSPNPNFGDTVDVLSAAQVRLGEALRAKAKGSEVKL